MLHLKRPGDPKASAYEFYIKQCENKRRFETLNTYGDPARKDYENKSELSGRKTYRKTLSPALPKVNTEDDKKYSVKLFDGIEPKNNFRENNISVESFPKFSVKINFDNLTKDELGLLCFAIQLNNEEENSLSQNFNSGKYLCHQIGYGKNFGLGAVKFFIDEIITYDQTLSKIDFKTKTLIENFSFIGDEELTDSLTLRITPTKYPTKDGEIKKWHQELRTEDFKVRRGRSDISLKKINKTSNGQKSNYSNQSKGKNKDWKKHTKSTGFNSDSPFKDL